MHGLFVVKLKSVNILFYKSLGTKISLAFFFLNPILTGRGYLHEESSSLYQGLHFQQSPLCHPSMTYFKLSSSIRGRLYSFVVEISISLILLVSHYTYWLMLKSEFHDLALTRQAQVSDDQLSLG